MQGNTGGVLGPHNSAIEIVKVLGQEGLRVLSADGVKGALQSGIKKYTGSRIALNGTNLAYDVVGTTCTTEIQDYIAGVKGSECAAQPLESWGHIIQTVRDCRSAHLIKSVGHISPELSSGRVLFSV
jgi:hypothetical protein